MIMRHKLPILVVLLCSALVMAGVLANSQDASVVLDKVTPRSRLLTDADSPTHSNPSKAYKPGAYGKVKDAPMFICWREWDGEIRLGGVHKDGSTPINFSEEFFSVEVEGPSGSANQEHLMLAHGTTNLIVKSNYIGTIVCDKEPIITRTSNGWLITFKQK